MSGSSPPMIRDASSAEIGIKPWAMCGRSVIACACSPVTSMRVDPIPSRSATAALDAGTTRTPATTIANVAASATARPI